MPYATMEKVPQALYKNKKWLVKEYQKRGGNEIARECRVGGVTIRRWLRRFGEKIRSVPEAHSLATSNHVTLSQEALEFLVGELLGDGSLSSTSKVSASYTHGSKYKSYLEWLLKKFEGYGIEQVGRIYKQEGWFLFPGRKVCWCTCYHYNSKAYIELKLLHRQWYREARADEKFKSGKPKRLIKILPKGLVLTPLIVRQWYIGDGSLWFDCREGAIAFNCQGFETNEVEILVKKLAELGFIVRKNSNNQIRLSSKSTKALLKYIGPCPIDCYKYKWDIERRQLCLTPA